MKRLYKVVAKYLGDTIEFRIHSENLVSALEFARETANHIFKTEGENKPSVSVKQIRGR